MVGRKKAARPEPLELIARILSCERNYYIGHLGWTTETAISDEAALVVEATIERVSKPLQKHAGEPISFRLLHAQRYPASSSQTRAFFGSITLRGNQRHALAYLPGHPFWVVPDLISEGADVIDVNFEELRQGHGDLVSLYIGRSEELSVELGTSLLPRVAQ